MTRYAEILNDSKSRGPIVNRNCFVATDTVFVIVEVRSITVHGSLNCDKFDSVVGIRFHGVLGKSIRNVSVLR